MNWSQELLLSAIWLGKAFAITLVCSLLAGWSLLHFSRWGRQFWRLSGDLFRPSLNGWRPVLSLLVIVLLTLSGVRLNVLFSRWYNEMYTSLQKLDAKLFWASILIFAILATVHVSRILLNTYLSQGFLIRWREWLNERLLTRWLDHQAYYRSEHLAKPADNPDQRIQQDIASFVNSSLSLSMGVIGSLVSIFEFTLILWGLSGTLALLGVEVPRGMVFAVYLYVIIATVFAFRIGRPLIMLNFLNEKLGADYRYALVRLREYSESIAFYGGEAVEGSTLRLRFAKIISNAWAIVFRTLKFSGFNLTISQTAAIFPFVIQAPRFFAKQISLGDMIQTANAFGELQDGLSFFRSAYDEFAGFKAVLDRLTGFLDAVEGAAALPTPRVRDHARRVELQNVSIRTPAGRVLLDCATMHVNAESSMLIRGPSGSGKTTLLRAIAGLWPYCDGVILHPHDVLFLSQKPYLPLGSLRAALCYPHPATGNEAVSEALEAVHLGHLQSRLDEEADWSHILSLGEQQRLAFGRLLLAAPAVAFLDEATSAMDEELEDTLYRLVRERLPHTALVSVGHRSTLLVHHAQILQLDGKGGWQLATINS
ncbi:ABC transporter ATP-binding protein/permease [Vogesella indigofera]|uniref:ABC transporter ATP-binding protein/permease n=1 Tax=Vogesella indigofera TaxID=45465 RepID=UPI00234EBBD5|nr:ABC transporter ATP-binding protein/permease [Vogesella indigofera]MDC7701808.1 ABC transporter ATP-binding protein/permease [Vogesella indigofera]